MPWFGVMTDSQTPGPRPPRHPRRPCQRSVGSVRISCASTSSSIAAASSRRATIPRPATPTSSAASSPPTMGRARRGAWRRHGRVCLRRHRAVSWKELRDGGRLHPRRRRRPGGRRSGIAALIEAATAWVRERGVASVMLWTAAPNDGAQRLSRARVPPDDDRDDARRVAGGGRQRQSPVATKPPQWSGCVVAPAARRAWSIARLASRMLSMVSRWPCSRLR